MSVRAALNTSSWIATFCVLAGLIAFSGARMERRPRPPASAEQLIYLPQAKYLRAISLGYHNVLADLLWFRTIGYFGEHYRSERSYPWLAHMCDLVTDLDPRAEYVYRFAGVILPWEAGQADAGNRILEKGIQVFPNSWWLHYLLGFNYYFFTNDFAKAALHMQRSAHLPNAPGTVVRLAAILAAEQSGPDTAVQFLKEMEDTVESPEMREIVRRHLREAKLSADLTRLNAAVQIFRARLGYVPLSLQALVDAGVVSRVPADPFGGVYEIDLQSGIVSSSTGHQPPQLHQSEVRQKLLRGESVRDP